MDDEKLRSLALQVWQYKQGEVVSLMIYLGDRLGLYQAMAGAGPLTAADLARRTSLHERWLLEWMRGQAAAGLLETADGEVFAMSDEAGEVLANDRTSLWFAAGAFLGAVVPTEVVEGVAEAFRTGHGLSYDDMGPAVAHGVERMLEPWIRLALVPRILPALDGLVAKLSEGARVVDVGCGSGLALVEMAAAYPESRFVGLDPSQHAIDRARIHVAQAQLQNVELRQASVSDLAVHPAFDFVLTLDCLHDMPRPDAAIGSIRSAIAPDGTWLIKDIRAGATWADNQRNPMLAMLYGQSVATCMSSALSEPGGAGLGTLGFDSGLAERMCREAGFTRFRLHDFDDPANLYYEVRP